MISFRGRTASALCLNWTVKLVQHNGLLEHFLRNVCQLFWKQVVFRLFVSAFADIIKMYSFKFRSTQETWTFLLNAYQFCPWDKLLKFLSVYLALHCAFTDIQFTSYWLGFSLHNYQFIRQCINILWACVCVFVCVCVWMVVCVTWCLLAWWNSSLH